MSFVTPDCSVLLRFPNIKPEDHLKILGNLLKSNKNCGRSEATWNIFKTIASGQWDLNGKSASLAIVQTIQGLFSQNIWEERVATFFNEHKQFLTSKQINDAIVLMKQNEDMVAFNQ